MLPHDGRVVSSFIVRALSNKELEVYGDGTQTRSFCYVDDLTEALVKLMKSRADFTGPVNIGKPAEISILELAHKIIELTHSKSKIVFKPLPSDDPAQRQPDISLAKRVLKWQPRTSLDDGLRKTTQYFRKVLS